MFETGDYGPFSADAILGPFVQEEALDYMASLSTEHEDDILADALLWESVWESETEPADEDVDDVDMCEDGEEESEPESDEYYNDEYYSDESSVGSTAAPDDGDVLTELASEWDGDDGDAPDGSDEEMELPCEMRDDGSEHDGMSIRAAREMGGEHGM